MGINLAKGQKISLEKESGQKLNSVMLGLGWDQKKAKGFLAAFKNTEEIDLDSSCLMFDANKDLLDVVWFRQLMSKDGSILHSGDNRTGVGSGDDERIIVELQAVPANIHYLVFTINSFTGQSFSSVENAYCRLVNQANGEEIARYNLSGGGNYRAQIMVKLYRHDGEWKLHAIGESGDGQTFLELVPTIQSQL